MYHKTNSGGTGKTNLANDQTTNITFLAALAIRFIIK